MSRTVNTPIRNDLISILACPRDHSELQVECDRLICGFGHSYPVVDGIPIFLMTEKEQTIGVSVASLSAAEDGKGAPLYLDTLGVSEEQKQQIAQYIRKSNIDPVISYLIGATSGHGYAHQIGRLRSYPIPDIPLEGGQGRLLLDVGSNWGRWSVSAARKGYRVVGIDPSLGALLAARRAFSKEGLDIDFVCGDARFLPFMSAKFQVVFSYSVLQHFSEQDAEAAIREISRTLISGGVVKVQMAHSGGLRSRYVRSRSDYMCGGKFRVRYWSLFHLEELFERYVGATHIVSEAFGGLGLLFEDRSFLSMKAKILVITSIVLKRLSGYLPFLNRYADSVYVNATKR